MCVIVVKPYGETVEEKTLRRASVTNKDGLGVYSYNPFEDQGWTFKSKQYTDEINKYNKPHLFSVFHFRLTSAGGDGLKNLHPFHVKSGWYLFHNGTILNLKHHKTISDTRRLANRIAKFENFEPYRTSRVIEAFTNDKFVFVKDDKYWIVNEDRGIWHKGCWFSNDGPIADQQFLFVYGTMKKGFHNHILLNDAEFVDYGYTRAKYPMIIDQYPYVLDLAGTGHLIEGEVYKVDEDLLEKLDKQVGTPVNFNRHKTFINLYNKYTTYTHWNGKERTSDRRREDRHSFMYFFEVKNPKEYSKYFKFNSEFERGNLFQSKIANYESNGSI